MQVFIQHKTKEKSPDAKGWYNTDKGNVYWNGSVWSCREDRESAEFPSLWYAASELSETVQINASEWEALDKQIADCYGHEDPDTGEWIENDDENMDLGTIGEIAAKAFGYL